jgi:hypothetical protein
MMMTMTAAAMLMASTRDGNCERDIIIDYMYDIGYMCGGGVLDVYTLCHSDVVCLEVIYLLRLLQCRIVPCCVVILLFFLIRLFYHLHCAILSSSILFYLLSYVLITCRIAWPMMIYECCTPVSSSSLNGVVLCLLVCVRECRIGDCCSTVYHRNCSAIVFLLQVLLTIYWVLSVSLSLSNTL